ESDSVSGLVMDRFERLWIATYKGMFSLDTLEMQWEAYTIEEGVGNNIFRGIEFGNDNDLWVPGDNGVVHWYMPIEEADIAVKIDGPSKVIGQPGAQLDYTLTISNIGNSAGDVILSLERPPTLTMQSLSPAPAIIDGERYSLGIMAAGESQTLALSLTGDLSSYIGSDHLLAATGSAGSRETIVANNRVELNTRTVAPDRADVAVSLSGPPVLVSNQTVIYEIIAENLGALDAGGAQLTLELPTGLSFVSADPPPSALNPLSWDLGSLDSSEGATPRLIRVTAQSGDLSSSAARLVASATVSTSTVEDITNNNSAIADLPVSGLDAETIFLVAPQRLAEQYGTSQVLDRLYELAQHPTVNGLVLNIESDPLIAARFAVWDSSIKDWRASNALAADIKQLLSTYTATYPNLKSLVIVGGDSVIPHYRLPDRNPTMWQERSYAAQVGNLSSVYYAMSSNLLLTDDFYGAESPVVPSSVFWPDQSPFYLPEIALGRLVETPEEIIATVDLFLERDGVYPFSEALIGGDEELASDLVDAECSTIQSLGYATTCTLNEASFRSALTNQPDLIWTAWHSNHYGMGLFGDALTPNDIARYLGEGALNATIGCHAGLNVPDSGALFDKDLTQSFAAKGSITIGSTGYTYGSFSELGYTELLYQAILEQLSSGPTTVGEAVLAAKRQYYASRGWFDTLDEKTLLPVTTFGLPMSRVDLPSPALTLRSAGPEASNILLYETISLTLSLDDYEMVSTVDGTYFTYLDQTQSQHQLPIQPAHRMAIPVEKDGQRLKDYVLRSVSYAQINEFDPLIDESWAMGAPLNQISEPLINFSGWDREMPVNLSKVGEGRDLLTYIDLTLGRYNAEAQVEQLVLGLEIELLYGDEEDAIPPIITGVNLNTLENTLIQIEVEAEDKSGIDQIIVLYELESGHLSSVDLTQEGDVWRGSMPTSVKRYLIQVVDQAQNMSRTDWSSDFSDSPPLQSTPTAQPTATLPPPTFGPTATPTGPLPTPAPVGTPVQSTLDLFLPFILSQDRLVTSYDSNGQ
ncbi:MAG: C25 family cysteine peptidase, partial [Chloroflexota bacterium]